MLEKLMVNLGPVRANKHAEALMNDVSRRFAETTDVNIIFTCFLVTPIGKRYYSAVTRPSQFAASMETMWKKGLVTLSKAFHYGVTQMISLFHDYLGSIDSSTPGAWTHHTCATCEACHMRIFSI
jgi:nitrate reductase gamma subunit